MNVVDVNNHNNLALTVMILLYQTMFRNRHKSVRAMGVDMDQNIIWCRKYRLSVNDSKDILSEIKTRSACSNIVILVSVAVVIGALCVCKLNEAK